LANLYQHKVDGTYYTKIFVGGIVTRQIHPDGVAYLKNQGVRLEGEIPSFAMSVLMSRNWLHTKDEVHAWGEVDWAPDWNSIGAPAVNPYKEAVRKMAAEKRRRQLEAEAAQERVATEARLHQQRMAQKQRAATREARPAGPGRSTTSAPKQKPARKLPATSTWLSGEGPVKTPLVTSPQTDPRTPRPVPIDQIPAHPTAATPPLQQPSLHDLPGTVNAAVTSLQDAPRVPVTRSSVVPPEAAKPTASVQVSEPRSDRVILTRSWIALLVVAILLLVCLAANIVDMSMA
jgi:hypothetical protein